MLVVKQGQCFLDKVLQSTGSLTAAFEMALLNNLSITDDLDIGFQIRPGTIDKKSIVGFWQDDGKEPSTNLFNQSENLKAGIDYWAVDLDFVVQ